MIPFISHLTGAAGQATTNDYADVEFVDRASGEKHSIIQAPTSGPVSFHLKNDGANSLTYKVLGSNDPSMVDGDWMVVVAEAALAGPATADEFVDIAYFLFYKIQAKSTVADNAGNIIAAVASKRY